MRISGKTVKAVIAAIFIIGLAARYAYAMPTVYPVSTTILNPLKAYKGNVMYRTSIDDVAKILLIDLRGNILHSWTASGYDNLNYAEPLDNGGILAIARRMDQSTAVIELDWDSNLIMEYYNVSAMVHHDIERLDNGNTLILYREVRSVPEISKELLLDDFIAEVTPEGETVWEWHTYEHFDEFGFSDEAKQVIYEAGGDWAHTNSIQSLPRNSLNDPRFAEGNLLVSQRETNTIFVIDRETGQIVWKAGPDDNLTIAQHQAQMIRQGFTGAGRILVFDNGGDAGYPSQFRFYSRVVEIEPLTKKVVNMYKASDSNMHVNTFFSYSMSGVQRLPNGNTLVTEAETGRFFQITPDGEIAWEYINPYFEQGDEYETNMVYRSLMINRNWPLSP